eukprot:4621224-Ditylum_brightwellii.AAC.1
MNVAGAWSAPFLRTDLPKDATILPPKLAFKAKLTGEDNKYELYTRMCANGSIQIAGFNFDSSYTPVSYIDNIKLILGIGSAENMSIFVIYFSNAFQTNKELDPRDHQNIGIPTYYINWF